MKQLFPVRYHNVVFAFFNSHPCFFNGPHFEQVLTAYKIIFQ
jgi:hypothetical protein